MFYRQSHLSDVSGRSDDRLFIEDVTFTVCQQCGEARVHLMPGVQLIGCAAAGVYTAGDALWSVWNLCVLVVADVSAAAAGIQATPALTLAERNSSLRLDWVEVQPCAAPPCSASSQGCFSTWCWVPWCSAPWRLHERRASTSSCRTHAGISCWTSAASAQTIYIPL